MPSQEKITFLIVDNMAVFWFNKCSLVERLIIKNKNIKKRTDSEI